MVEVSAYSRNSGIGTIIIWVRTACCLDDAMDENVSRQVLKADHTNS